MASADVVAFVGGVNGAWQVTSMRAVAGEPLPEVACVDVMGWSDGAAGAWVLRGQTSNIRYTSAAEVARLRMLQEGLGRGEATCAALIPICKSERWWALAQDERRQILEEQSHHIAEGLKTLPMVARRLHHSRDLGEPFDFLTWFEFAPEHTGLFEELVRYLRSTEEWTYVEREVDVRLQLRATQPW